MANTYFTYNTRDKTFQVDVDVIYAVYQFQNDLLNNHRMTLIHALEAIGNSKKVYDPQLDYKVVCSTSGVTITFSLMQIQENLLYISVYEEPDMTILQIYDNIVVSQNRQPGITIDDGILRKRLVCN